MEKLILAAGATGNLGQKICRELIKVNAKVRAIVREDSNTEKVSTLEKMGVDLLTMMIKLTVKLTSQLWSILLHLRRWMKIRQEF